MEDMTRLEQLNHLNLIELYEEFQTILDEQFDEIPQELENILETAKNGIDLKIHIGVLHNEIGFQHKPKGGTVIFRGNEFEIEEILDEVNDRKVMLKGVIRDLLTEEDETVRGMTEEDEIEHMEKKKIR